MEKRHRRVVAQRAGGKALFQFTQHVPGHRVQIGERLRAELDPDQFDQFGIGMDHALDAMGDRGRVRGEESRIETLDAAGRGDGARDQEQAGRIGQEACIRERLPWTVKLWTVKLWTIKLWTVKLWTIKLRRGAVGVAAEAEAGFLAGLAD